MMLNRTRQTQEARVGEYVGEQVRLTSLSHGAGCACKLPLSALDELMATLGTGPGHPGGLVPAAGDLLVGAAEGDDAAVLRLDSDRALVLTTDFFTPIVDDARDWGRVAATNALSDVYAMGGRPLWCLNLVGWPRDKLPLEILGDVLRGGADMAVRAGALILGGHSIDDPEPKYGLVVVGEVHPDRMTSNGGARVGDRIVLTKPIGTGIITTALKMGAAPGDAVRAATDAMTSLNDGAALAAAEAGVVGATDVSGFGLLGHLGAMLAASRVAADIWAGAVPRLVGVRRLAVSGHIPGGTRRNLVAAAAMTTWDDTLDEVERLILADAQTSGGLLLAVHPEALAQLLASLTSHRTLAAAVIGTVRGGEPGTIAVHSGGGAEPGR
jgi:selenide,water dikinase